MVLGLARSLKGTDGRITYPGVGALIGEMFSWTLYSEDMKTYTLKAQCKQLHEMLWDEVGDKRRVELRISKDRWVVASPVEGATILRNGRSIIFKGVTLEKLEK